MDSSSSSSPADDATNYPSIDEIRLMANRHFSDEDYDTALPLYDLAVDLARKQGSKEDSVIHLCNRSACLFKMERFEEAKTSAQEAVEASNGTNIKAYFRLARTQIALRQYTSSLTTIQIALRLLPPDSPQKTDFLKLQSLARKRQNAPPEPEFDLSKIKSVKTEPRKPSIKEFDLKDTLGEGNFSKVVVAEHKITGEKFALKIIEKKQAANLAKRQHPNVYNEINMERKVLLERLPDSCRHVIKMYHAFQDYNNLYFLMDLHLEGGDLWSRLKYRDKMVGCHPSQIKPYIIQLLSAIEHLHNHGIIHRDIKTENILLSTHDNIILIDFGTAKDLFEPDLNGPEFVGTSDFMSPEAIKGKEKGNKGGVDHTGDLWTLGAVLFQLFAGVTPFASKSPYLTFLRIQRGTVYRNWAIGDEDGWDLIKKLMMVDPRKRIGADCFYFEGFTPPDAPKDCCQNYDVIRSHPFLQNATVSIDTTPIPSLQDLCIRVCAELVELDSQNLDVPDPGDNSSHDLLRLNPLQRQRIMHILDQLDILSSPRVYRRFFRTRQETRLSKVRPWTHDFVGLKQNFKPGQQQNEQEATKEEEEKMEFVYLVNPLFVKENNLNTSDDDEQRSKWTEQLKDSIRKINRRRPKAVVAAGYLDPSCRKLLGKINETIPVILADGTEFFEFWNCENEGLVLKSDELLSRDKDDQRKWLYMQLEQSRMSGHYVFAFVDCDVRKISEKLVQKLARSKVLAVFGVAKENFEVTIGQQKRPDGDAAKKEEEEDSDDESRDDDDEDEHEIKLLGGCEMVKHISLGEDGTWTADDFS